MRPKAAAKRQGNRRKGQWMRRALFAIAATSMAMACGQGLAQVRPPSFASSGNGEFDTWRDDFARRAVAQGRDPAVLRQLLSGIQPDDSIVTLDQQQPEFVSPVWDYVNNRLTDRRIAAGIQMK